MSITFIGIDAAGRAAGICVESDNGTFFDTIPIDRVGELPFESWVADEVVVAVECPGRMFRGSAHAVRACANLFIRRFREEYKRKIKFIGGKNNTVTPETWRAFVLQNAPGTDWKERALWYCNRKHPHIDDHNQAEAYCLMEFAKAFYLAQKTRGK